MSYCRLSHTMTSGKTYMYSGRAKCMDSGMLSGLVNTLSQQPFMTWGHSGSESFIQEIKSLGVMGFYLQISAAD